MIRVEIRRAPDERIVGFKLTGHADYDEAGKDIVCAGVTAVTFGTVNAIEALLQVDLDPKTPKRGHLDVVIPDPVSVSDETYPKLQLLLESMVHMIKGIESSYGKYVRVKDITIV
jgi:uncharacterized protein YsxB (DUF464 family)